MVRRYAFLFIGMIVLAVLIRMSVNGDFGAEHGATLKTFMIPFATIYLNTFNSASTAIVLCFVMVGGTAALYLYYWIFRIAPAMRDLRHVASQLRGIDAYGSRDALGKCDQVMERHMIVARSWRLYRSTLVARPGDRIAAQVQPERYFNRRMLDYAGVRLRFFLGLPNDLVGLGLVFTFMGLVAGLYFASRSMMSPDLGVAREALVQLLHAATFKFLTSITGIGLSLVLGWGQKNLLDGLHGQLTEIQFLLEEHFPMTPAGEGLLASPVPLRSAEATSRKMAVHGEPAI
jgi:hypothetical protein